VTRSSGPSSPPDAIRSGWRVFAIEPYMAVDVEPGDEFTWNNRFEFYTLPRE
jgi:hypothetical protein